VAGGTISAQQLIENIIVLSGTEHLANMKSASGMRTSKISFLTKIDYNAHPL
jgi:hypothetical protein